MPAGFQTLRDHRICPMGLEPQRFLHRGGGGHHPTAPALDPGQQIRRRQAEMKADHRRAKRLQHIGVVVVEGHTPGARRDVVAVQTEFAVVRGQRLVPARLLLCVGLGVGVAKEIDVERRPRGRLQRLQFGLQRGRAEHGGGH